MKSSNPSRKGFQKLFLLLVFSSLILVLSPIQASDFFPVNTWVTMKLPSSLDPNLSFRNGKDHVHTIPIHLEPNRRYTLKVQWGDGKSRVVSILGFNPLTHNYPSVPSQTTSSISVNVGGTNIEREVTFLHTFTTASSSVGNVGYVTFIGRVPHQEVRVMVTDPAESDLVVMQSIQGHTYGRISSLHLYLMEHMEIQESPIHQLAREVTSLTTVPYNQWVEATLPSDHVSIVKYRGEKTMFGLCLLG